MPFRLNCAIITWLTHTKFGKLCTMPVLNHTCPRRYIKTFIIFIATRNNTFSDFNARNTNGFVQSHIIILRTIIYDIGVEIRATQMLQTNEEYSTSVRAYGLTRERVMSRHFYIGTFAHFTSTQSLYSSISVCCASKYPLPNMIS